MTIIAQDNPSVTQYDVTDQFPQVKSVGSFVHKSGTSLLYISEIFNGQFRFRSITGVETGTSPYAPDSQSQGFYHPLGTNRLYLREGMGGAWADIGGVLVGESTSPPSPTPQYDGNFYHPVGTNSLYFLENDNGTLRWVNIASNQPGLNNDNVYYVSTSGVDQSGNGTQQSPFQTLEYALSSMTQSPPGECQIRLIGEGPYALPSQVHGVTPQGVTGQPLLICGDEMQQEFAGVVTAVSGNSFEFGGILSENAWRGFIYKGLTGTSAGYQYQIAHNTTNSVVSISSSFTVSPGDSFQILRPTTKLVAAGDFAIDGPGAIGFWRCEITCDRMVMAGASVLFDACTIVPSNRISGTLQAKCQFMATVDSDDFKVITSAGTQLGKVGAFFNNPAVDPANGLRMFDGSTGIGYIITKCGIVTWTTGRWILRGTDINLVGGGNSRGITVQSGGYIEMDGGYHRLILGGANGIGITVSQGATARITSASVAITQAATAAMVVAGGGVLSMDTVSGSLGNGLGVWVRDGGLLMNFGGNTVSGTGGDVLIDPNGVAIPWASVGSMAFAYPSGINTHRTPVANSAYTALITDQMIAYTTLTASRTVTLPAPASTGATSSYIKRMTVKDESGNASPSVTIVITGSPSVGPNTITTAYGSRSFYTNGTTWIFDE